ncbi:hypothetical protein [Zavarzinia sp.]|uniref:hypothetical protein n=1 Tax=Zavarzinia sp. TaxID=2027920 RepID=UPI0035642D2A
MARAASIALALAGLWSLPAAADQMPLPRVDYAITYQMQPGGHVMDMAHHAGWTRVDMHEQGQAMTGIMDLHSDRMIMLMETPMPMAFEVDMSQPMPGLPGAPGAGMSPQQMMTEADVKLTAIGAKTVAGVGCTLYDAVGTIGKDSARSKVCLTADNVMLYSETVEQGETYVLTATKVSFAAQDPARFKVPPGVRVIPMQQMLQGMGGLPGMPVQ